MSLPDLSWHADALCREVGGDLWHSTSSLDQADAITTCRRCDSDVRAKCLQWAVENKEVWGIWGGQPPHRRVDIVLLMRRRPDLDVVAAAAMVEADPALQVTPHRRVGMIPDFEEDAAA